MSNPLVLSRRIVRTLVPRVIYRQQSSFRSFTLRNAVVQGVVIGGTAVGTLTIAGYTIYHVSGAKQFVDTVRPATALLGKTQEKLAQGAFDQALKFLREAAKAYVAAVPFAEFFVDKAFDAAEDVAAAHSAEANAIITQAYNDISHIIREQGNEHVIKGAFQVVATARRFLENILALGSKAGQPISERLNLERLASETVARTSAALESAKSRANVAFGNKIKDKDHEVVSETTEGAEVVLPEGQSVPNEPTLTDRLGGISSKVVSDIKAKVPSALEITKNKAQDIFSRLKPKASVDSSSTESPLAVERPIGDNKGRVAGDDSDDSK